MAKAIVNRDISPGQVTSRLAEWYRRMEETGLSLEHRPTSGGGHGRGRIGLRVTVGGTMSDHDGCSVEDSEISFFSNTQGFERSNEGVATYTLDEFTKILGYMVAMWGVPLASRFARLIEGIRKTVPSPMRDGQRVRYEVPADLYSGSAFQRDPGMHAW